VIRVKVCGITNIGDAAFAVESGADALGFIFYPKSKRFVKPEQVREIVSELPPFVTTVGVVVNEIREDVERIADTAGLDALQIHGDESPDLCVGYTRPAIRAIRVGAVFGPEQIAPYAEVGVDTFLLDKAKDGFYGGTGETFDWTAAVLAKDYGRVILSGGMTPYNVEDGVAAVAPYAVDASSGVEAEPGKKDHAKVSAFIENVRRAGRED
jgi:phosphoribosylanthranilate isomerase